MLTGREIIQNTVKKLEQDAILPFQSLRPTLAVIHQSDVEETGEDSYLKSLRSVGSLYGAIVDDYIANTPFEAAQMITAAASKPQVHGIIIISDYGNMNRTLYNLIPVRLDIDSLSAASLGNLIGSISPIAYRNAPCTAVACMKIMETLHESEDFSGQRCLILGRSIRVGKPLAEILTQKNMTVTLAHSKSNEIASDPYNWDYIVSAIGKPKYWSKDNPLYIKSYGKNYIIDVGMNYDENGKLCGDVDREWFENELTIQSNWSNSFITPVTGGVGKVTTTVLFAKLFNNAADFFRNAAGLFQEPPKIVPQPQEEQEQQPQIVIQE